MSDSCLRNEIVIVKLIEENHAMHIPKGKNGHLKFEGSFSTYDAPLTKHNTIAEVLSKEEREELEGLLDSSRPKGWLSPYVQSKLNAWKGNNRFKIELGLNPIELDLSNYIDFIKYKILLANKKDIASSFETRLDAKYVYYIENKESADKNKVALIDSKIKASVLFSELAKSDVSILNALMVIYKGDTKKVPTGMNSNTAKATLFNYAEAYPVQFIDTIEADDYKTKAILYKALRRGIINRNGFDYNLGMGDGRLIGNGISEVLEYIKDLSTNNGKQDEYMKFKAALKD